ncbi:MAG: hypothetical protein A2W75_08535 [Nitrospinae bacterium RIFCSPLOWO2_12_39_15]|nr:MAG: hypothetical protein A2W53_06470 [Nitrospinae bacterium RIFCSPHIGHO2_02_39_11]OGV99494.1 MAG: hypothetical protein A3D97_02095 [Nitrospinae bacterium RIFCSPHIGHO2_12_FULL_39_42]OGW11121.1 MAG: hypothetical protein A2W75_08535 [Nitrospinae bacterium RIFCSPLOWO2_12_39_15]
MKIVSAIEDDIAIHKILTHLGLLHSASRSLPPIVTTLWEKESKSPLRKGDEGGYFHVHSFGKLRTGYEN